MPGHAGFRGWAGVARRVADSGTGGVDVCLGVIGSEVRGRWPTSRRVRLDSSSARPSIHVSSSSAISFLSLTDPMYGIRW